MTLSNGTEHCALVDTHRHPIGPKLAAKMAQAGFYDPKLRHPLGQIPQAAMRAG